MRRRSRRLLGKEAKKEEAPRSPIPTSNPSDPIPKEQSSPQFADITNDTSSSQNIKEESSSPLPSKESDQKPPFEEKDVETEQSSPVIKKEGEKEVSPPTNSSDDASDEENKPPPPLLLPKEEEEDKEEGEGDEWGEWEWGCCDGKAHTNSTSSVGCSNDNCILFWAFSCLEETYSYPRLEIDRVQLPNERFDCPKCAKKKYAEKNKKATLTFMDTLDKSGGDISKEMSLVHNAVVSAIYHRLFCSFACGLACV